MPRFALDSELLDNGGPVHPKQHCQLKHPQYPETTEEMEPSFEFPVSSFKPQRKLGVPQYASRM